VPVVNCWKRSVYVNAKTSTSLHAQVVAGQKSTSSKIPLQIAVMGCVVNGPGEAREADLGIAAGNKRGHLFVKGRNVAVVPESEMVEALVDWATYINEHGVDAAIARVDTALAEREATKDRNALLQEKGDDANHSNEKIVEIRKTIAGN
jgi:(E)-4-hydroxy-3-methylbut-2-enyl-diphosphate synthase